MKKAILHLRKADPALASVIDVVGSFRMTYTEPGFESLVRSIVFQQLNGKVASVIFGRLVVAAGERISPDALLSLTDVQMRAIGLSKQKTAYIRDLAAKAEAIDFPSLIDLDDEQVIERLTQVKGVGVWTAHMFLLFGLRRPDVLPTGDLGIRMAIRKLYELPELPLPKQIEEIARKWHPWCSVASWYLWRSLEAQKE